jgi:hypothetical protein
MNLDQFMNQLSVRNVYVSETGFLALYVRRNEKRLLNGRWVPDVLDIANVEATHKGQGAFKGLIKRIREKYPKWSIYVENILEPRLVAYLAREQFELCYPTAEPPSMFWISARRSSESAA